jgi:hypothetical protein
MSEHQPTGTEFLNKWCSVCARYTDHTASPDHRVRRCVEDHHPQKTKTILCHCDKCKQETPHELTATPLTKATGYQYRCVKCTVVREKELFEEADYSPEARHWAALDGMGNRGEPPPPIQLRTLRKENK